MIDNKRPNNLSDLFETSLDIIFAPFLRWILSSIKIPTLTIHINIHYSHLVYMDGNPVNTFFQEKHLMYINNDIEGLVQKVAKCLCIA